MDKQSTIQEPRGGAVPGKSSRLKRSWQVMIFDQYGEAITINHLQRYIITTGVGMLILLLAALCFAGLYIHEKSMRLEQQTELEQIKDKAVSLMDENNALTARLAVLDDSEEPKTEELSQEEQQEPSDAAPEVGEKPAEEAAR